MLKRLLIFLSICTLIMSLTGCKTSSIIDLIHPETEEIELSSKIFENSNYKPYLIEEVLFAPYTRQGDVQEIKDGYYYHYKLRLAVYKHSNNTSSVIVNSVKIVGNKDVTFKEINQDIYKPLEFINVEDIDSIQESENTLIEEINNYNMNLTDDSTLKVILNVSVQSNGNTITRDLNYDFETRTRTYMVTR